MTNKIIIALMLIFALIFTACGKAEPEGDISETQISENGGAGFSAQENGEAESLVQESSADETQVLSVPPEPTLPTNIVPESSQEYISPYGTRELSRDGGYKLMEMNVYYVSGDDWEISRRITFEVPVEWEGGSSVIAIVDEDYMNIMKVDMVAITSTTRDDVLDAHNNDADEFSERETFDKYIYTTENFEIFYHKYRSIGWPANAVYRFMLYANGESFYLTGYVFVDNIPEHDAIFKRIAESVTFQF